MGAVRKQKKLAVENQKSLAEDVYSKYRILFESLDTSQRARIEDHLNDGSSLGDVFDQLALLQDYLESVTDGRPQPIDFSSTHGHSEDRIKMAGQYGDELRDENRQLRQWAECSAPGYNEKARIGGVHLTTDGLANLRDWIEQVITWHNANPKRGK